MLYLEKSTLSSSCIAVSIFPSMLLLIFMVSIADYSSAVTSIPIEGAVYSVIRSDGSQKTYLDVVIGSDFTGKLPDDIDTISVSAPFGNLSITKDDFNYNAQWRAFWLVLPGQPSIGKYTFTVASGGISGVGTDTQSVNRVIPLPDAGQFVPVSYQPQFCATPSFSWPLVTADFPLYYQLEINSGSRNIYRTEYVLDMNSVRIPIDTLESGIEYRWRVKVADGPDWSTIQNRSQSRWRTFIINPPTNSCTYIYTPPVDSSDGWEVSSLIDEGLNEKVLTTLMTKILNGEIPNIQGIVIAKNNKLVFEEYFGGYALHVLHPLASVSKSITSLLIGIALDKKIIPSVNNTIYELLPPYESYDWDASHRAIRLKHVLSMTAGLAWNSWEFPDGDMRDSSTAMSRSEDWIQYTLNRKTADKPGTKFVYNNGLTLLLGEIIRNTSGIDADEFAEKYLFSLLDITDHQWSRAKNNIVQTAGGLSLRPRDMAKIGSVMLNNGVWKGRQIIPANWVQESTKSFIREHILFGSGYGYQWWQGESFIGDKKIDLFYAAGKGGQYIFICPELDLVTVVTSEVRDNPMGEYRPQMMMTNYVIPSVFPRVPPKTTKQFDVFDKERYVGEYSNSTYDITLKIVNESNELLYIDPERKKGRLHFLSENTCIADSAKMGNVRAYFSINESGEVTHLMLQIGLGFWQLDKVE